MNGDDRRENYQENARRCIGRSAFGGRAMKMVRFFGEAGHPIDVNVKKSLRDSSKKGGCVRPAPHISEFVDATVEGLLRTENRKIYLKKFFLIFRFLCA